MKISNAYKLMIDDHLVIIQDEHGDSFKWNDGLKKWDEELKLWLACHEAITEKNGHLEQAEDTRLWRTPTFLEEVWEHPDDIEFRNMSWTKVKRDQAGGLYLSENDTVRYIKESFTFSRVANLNNWRLK